MGYRVDCFVTSDLCMYQYADLPSETLDSVLDVVSDGITDTVTLELLNLKMKRMPIIASNRTPARRKYGLVFMSKATLCGLWLGECALFTTGV